MFLKKISKWNGCQKIRNPHNKKYEVKKKDAGEKLLGSLKYSCKAEFDILFTLDYRLTGESLNLQMKISGGEGGGGGG